MNFSGKMDKKMAIITRKGLRKHLEEMVAAGKDAYEVLKADTYREGPGEVGTLLEDDIGFYINVVEIRNLEISHIRRIEHEDIVRIFYGNNPWSNPLKRSYKIQKQIL